MIYLYSLRSMSKCFRAHSLVPCCASHTPLFNSPYFDHRRSFSLESSIQSVVRTQSGIFKTMSESAPVEYLQSFLINCHDTTGLPWWATIVCTTVVLRSAVTVPLAIYQQYILGKVHNIRLELIEVSKELKREVATAVKMYNWDHKTAKYCFDRSLKKQWNLLVVRENCHPIKASLLLWFQLPLWISFSVALRNIVFMLPNDNANAQVAYAELSVGGFGWISNLTQADPLFIMPIALGLINLTIIELQALSKAGDPTKLQRYALNFFRVLTIVMIPITFYIPSCMTLYWTTSSVYGLIQNLVLLSPKVKRFCRIPQTTAEIEKPYSHVVKELRNKLNHIPRVLKFS